MAMSNNICSGIKTASVSLGMFVVCMDNIKCVRLRASSLIHYIIFVMGLSFICTTLTTS